VKKFAENLKKMFRLKRGYVEERQRLRDAVAAGLLRHDAVLGRCRGQIEEILGWSSWLEGGDWVELEAEASERGIPLNTASDLLALLDRLDGLR
jgi:hypothetical protein